MAKKRKGVRRFRFRAYDLLANLIFGLPFFAIAGAMITFTVWGMMQTGRVVAALPLLGLGVGGLWALVQLFRRARIAVGRDGIAFFGRRPKAIPKFVPWTDVIRVEDDGSMIADSLRIELADGTVFRVPRVDGLQELLSLCRERQTQALAREQREVPAALLEDPAAGEKGYRDARVPKGVLLDVAAEPRAPVKVRVRAIEMAAEAGAKKELEELLEITAEPTVAKKLEKLAG